ncbi:MAG: SBBP repeat-containing protein [Desulfobacterales bacterium]|nr:MAG: SBBP repeat-containing protein [Desulfobacterales bacterium]
MALDPDGNVIITGETNSTNFPLQHPVRDDLLGSRDAFVTKFNPTLSSIVYSTYLGGSGEDRGSSVATDLDGNAFITGYTRSINFPLTDDAIDKTCGSDGFCNPYITDASISQKDDAFASKLNPTGTALIFSTYLGGINKEFGQGIAVHAAGGSPQAWVTGKTLSPDFPTLNPIQGTYGESEHTGGNGDVFLTRFNAAGSGLVFSTYLGGIGPDGGEDIMVDSGGNV